MTVGSTTESAAAATDIGSTGLSAQSRMARWGVVTAGLVALVLAVFTLIATMGESGSGPADDSADAGFARDMAVHHQQAVEMSFIVRDRTDDENVRRLAYDIANTQANQRGMLLGWLDLWGLNKISGETPMAWMGSGHSGHEARDGALMTGMATRTELGELGRARGKAAEIMYLQLMTKHHMGGVKMARGCVERCEVKQEKDLAQGMVDAQESEMRLMADLLTERGSSAPRK